MFGGDKTQTFKFVEIHFQTFLMQLKPFGSAHGGFLKLFLLSIMF